MSYQFDYLIIQCDSINSIITYTTGIHIAVTCKQSGMDYTYICVVSTQRTFQEHPNAYTVSIKVIRFSSLSGALVSEYWYAGMIPYSCVGGVAG